MALVTPLLGACSDDDPDVAPTPSPTVTRSPAESLAALAHAGEDAAYTATYALRAEPAGTYVVQRRAGSFRLDIDLAGAPRAILVQNSSGTFACQKRAGRKPTCLKLASRGEKVPRQYAAAANAGQQLFTDYLEALANDVDAYDVELTTGTPADGDVPPGTCFEVRPAADGDSAAVAAGTYCLSAEGIPTRAEFASGELVLQRLSAAPEARLTPPARPTPLTRG